MSLTLYHSIDSITKAPWPIVESGRKFAKLFTIEDFLLYGIFSPTFLGYTKFAINAVDTITLTKKYKQLKTFSNPTIAYSTQFVSMINNRNIHLRKEMILYPILCLSTLLSVAKYATSLLAYIATYVPHYNQYAKIPQSYQLMLAGLGLSIVSKVALAFAHGTYVLEAERRKNNPPLVVQQFVPVARNNPLYEAYRVNLALVTSKRAAEILTTTPNPTTPMIQESITISRRKIICLVLHSLSDLVSLTALIYKQHYNLYNACIIADLAFQSLGAIYDTQYLERGITLLKS